MSNVHAPEVGYQLLDEALAGRAPVFIADSALEPGHIMWMRDSLPRVFVSPDIFEQMLDVLRSSVVKGGGA